MAAGTCLALLALAVNDTIVQAVIPFIEAHITSPDWHFREAAVMAFGSILDGPDPTVLAPLIHQALPVLLTMMGPGETNEAVKDTAAWTVARICDLHAQSLDLNSHVQSIVSAVVAGLESTPRVSANCAWAIQSLSENLSGYDDENILPTDPLSMYYEGLFGALMRITEKCDSHPGPSVSFINHFSPSRSTNEGNFRTAAYETMSTLISHSAQDTLHVVQSVVLAMLQRQEHLLTIQNQIVGVDDRTNWNELQSNFCSILVVCLFPSTMCCLLSDAHLHLGCGPETWSRDQTSWRSYHDKYPATCPIGWPPVYCFGGCVPCGRHDGLRIGD